MSLVFHVELDLSLDREDHAAFVILAALKEYAAIERVRAEETAQSAEFHTELADTADHLHALIDDQMALPNIREIAS